MHLVALERYWGSPGAGWGRSIRELEIYYIHARASLTLNAPRLPHGVSCAIDWGTPG